MLWLRYKHFGLVPTHKPASLRNKKRAKAVGYFRELSSTDAQMRYDNVVGNGVLNFALFAQCVQDGPFFNLICMFRALISNCIFLVIPFCYAK